MGERGSGWKTVIKNMVKYKERGKNKQLAINMLAALLSFLVSLGIRFFLPPYVVKSLGADAYGFIGLSTNILSYTSLITIALNSMAGRFITIKYQEGNIEMANKYYASVFYSNLFLAILILGFGIGVVVWTEYLIKIPEPLVKDVKLLLGLLVINNILGLMSSLWGIATFIKNRLDLSNVQTVIGNLLNALVLLFAFYFFLPHIWYMGVAGIVLTVYCAITNYRYSIILTPELYLKSDNFELDKVFELLKSGVWNLFSKLGEILSQGLDLLIANLCIGAVEMGLFAITKNVPFLILSLFQSISGVFAPILTTLYAKGKRDEMVSELFKSIRMLGLFSAVPLICLYVYGDCFYSLWLPSEDSQKLQMLTILGTFALPCTMPLESLWNIFTITNKLKYSTYFMLANSLVVFFIVMSSMFFVESHELRLIILASTRSICGLVRGLVFLPIYGAYCLNLSKTLFYGPIFKSMSYLLLSFSVCYLLRFFIIPDTWAELVCSGGVICVICLILGLIMVLNKQDCQLLYRKIMRRK